MDSERRPASGFVIGVALGALVLGLVSAAPTAKLDGRDGQDPGQAIFRGKGNCFACHGPDAKGTVLAPNLTDEEWLNFPGRPEADQVKALVKSGVPKPKKHPAPMLPMGGARLSDQEVDQVVAWVLGLSAPR